MTSPLKNSVSETEGWVNGEFEHGPHDLNLVEVGMSGCGYGCKIYRCETCGAEKIFHYYIYGCPKDESQPAT